MANLTSASPRTYEVGLTFQDYPVKASSKIYEGSAVSDVNSSGNTGYVSTLTATEDFIGFAYATADNSASGATDGGITVNVATKGNIVLSVTGATVASLGATVYASDGNTFTTTSTSNSSIGKVLKWISGTKCLVHFEGAGERSI